MLVRINQADALTVCGDCATPSHMLTISLRKPASIALVGPHSTVGDACTEKLHGPIHGQSQLAISRAQPPGPCSIQSSAAAWSRSIQLGSALASRFD
eukprot:4807477-Prymnesium_polylepis.1